MDKKRFAELKCLTMVFGYTLRDEQLFNKSLTHKSFANENQHQGLEIRHNERFEFLGDSVIDLIISRYMVFQNRNMTEGELSKIRAQLVNEYSLAEFAKSIGLGEYLLLGKGEEASGGRNKTSILANSFEALIAAFFLDSSFDETYELFLNLFRDKIDSITIEKKITDYKGHLQKHCQAHILSTPTYKLIDQSGPDHQKSFKVQAFILGDAYGIGTGKTKKEAEQAAARISYETLSMQSKYHP
jgi:ribonuclease-3